MPPRNQASMPTGAVERPSDQDPRGDSPAGGPWPTPADEANAAELREGALSPTAKVGMTEAAAAFDADWLARQELMQSSPVIAFLRAHELAGSPNELTITGVHGIKVSLGDLRSLVRGLE